MAAISPLLRCYGLYRGRMTLVAVVLLCSGLAQGSFGIQQHLVGKSLQTIVEGLRAPPFAAESLHAWLILLGALALGRALLSMTGAVLASQLGQHLASSLRAGLHAQALRLGHDHQRRHGVGEMVSRTTRDSDQVREAVVNGTRQLLETGIFLAGCMGYLLWVDPLFGAVPTLLVLVATVLFVRQADTLVILDGASGEAYDRMVHHFTEDVVGVRTLRAFAREGAHLHRFGELLDAYLLRARRSLAWGAVRLPLPKLVVALGHGWILAYGALLVSRGVLDIGTFIAALMLMTGVIFRIEAVGRSVRDFAAARSSAARVWEVLDAVPTVVDAPASSDATSRLPHSPPPPATHQQVVDAVPGPTSHLYQSLSGPLTLRYAGIAVVDGGRRILDHIDLELAPGTITALVGATGSGKSCLCHLAVRFLDPVEGRIELVSADGIALDIRCLPLADLRRRVQVVTQGGHLFSATVAENLRLNVPDADDAAVHRALAAAAADDLPERLPQGLATLVGERGTTLSGGQRQRLCLARALLATPAVLLLDDATSALDAATEARVLAALRGGEDTGTGPAVLLVASRLSTLLAADRVLLLHQGRIVAAGSHAAMAAGNPIYCDLLGLDP